MSQDYCSQAASRGVFTVSEHYSYQALWAEPEGFGANKLLYKKVGLLYNHVEAICGQAAR